MFYTFSAFELQALFIKKEISATEIAEQTLARIGAHDSQVGAFLSVFSERVLSKARQLDEKRAHKKHLGRLAGVPIALKDNLHVHGELTTCGSKFLANYRAVFSATVTRLIEEEDALLIGKTNLDEFAMGSSTENSAYQTTKNPWNLKCSPGGSSGGSAACVAARFCPIAFGSDTGGSIRQPASFTGIVGFKPSYGRVSRFGLVAFGSSLDQIGPFTTNVKDAALVLEVVGKHCPHDPTSLSIPKEHLLDKIEKPIQGMKIGIAKGTMEALSKEVRDNFKQALDIFKELGCIIVEIDLDLLKSSIAVYYILATAEASTNLARFDGVRYGVRSPRAKTVEEIFDLSRTEGFGAEVKRRILLGTYVLSSGYQDAYYRKAQKVRTLMIESFKKAFEVCDVIASPTSPSSAFELEAIQDPLTMYLQDIYTIPANLAGLPAISIPSGFCPEGKPLGLHLTAPRLEDIKALHTARGFEKASRWNEHIPPLFRS